MCVTSSAVVTIKPCNAQMQAAPERGLSQLVCLLLAHEGDKRTSSGAVVEGAPQTSCKERKTL